MTAGSIMVAILLMTLALALTQYSPRILISAATFTKAAITRFARLFGQD
jgi:hypothetical protein